MCLCTVFCVSRVFLPVSVHYANDTARVVHVLQGVLLFHFILAQSDKILAQFYFIGNG